MIGIQKRTILGRVLFVGALVAAYIGIEKVPAKASNAEYVPPPGPERIQRTEGAGSRGDCFTPVTLSLLAPKNHVGQTVSERPVFLWYASSASVPLRFTLVEPGVAEPIIDRQIKINKPGIVRFQLPQNVAGLEPHKEYQWAVEAICNSFRPSANIYARSLFEYEPVTPELARDLERAGTEEEKIAVYAKSGMWYDAISNAYDLSQNSSRKLTSTIFSELLDRIGLAEIALKVKDLTRQALLN